MLYTTYNLARKGGISCNTPVEQLEAHYEKSVEEYGKDTPVPLDVVHDVLDESDFLWVVQNAIPKESLEECANFLVEYLGAVTSKLSDLDVEDRGRVLCKLFIDGDCFDSTIIDDEKDRHALLSSILKKYCNDESKTE